MKRNNVITLGVLAMGATTSAFAGTEMDALKDRITALESASSATTVAGEISATYGSGANTTLGDAKFSIAHAVNEQFDGSIVVKWDGDASTNDIDLKEAVMNYNHEFFTVSMGRVGVPFGAYDTGMITDPLTKGVTDADKGEQDMLMVSTTFGDVEVVAYTYEATDADKGLSINYANDMFSVDADYFSDGTDGRSSSKAFRIGLDADSMVSGLSFYAEKVTTDQTAGYDNGDHFEMNYGHTVMGTDANLTLARSYEDLPASNQDQKGFTYSIMPAEGVTFAIEHNKKELSNSINTVELTYKF